MTKDIADLMKNNLSDFSGSDKIISTLAGLTRVFEYKGTDGEVKKLAYPLDCNQPEPNCQECEELFVLVPDQSKRCIVYFEGGASNPVQNLEGATKYQATISLVCWYNLQGFTTVESLQSRLIALFSERCKNITTTFQAEEAITGISIEVLKVQDSDPSIFSKYTYSQDKSQYLGCPFSSFKIDFKTNFTLYENPICFDGIVVSDIPNCC